jgi:hypothetical protein
MAATTHESFLLGQVRKRRAIPTLLTACFDKQVAFLEDRARRKALFVARRSGKTWAIAVALIKYALEEPATKCLYYGLTRESAWNTIYLHMLEPLCRQFGINVKVNLTMQTLTFDNASYIKVMGDDASDKQINHGLGGTYKGVVFDECQAINHDLDSWVNAKLAPAMVDLDGTIILAGTAGVHMGDRFWFRVTKTEGVREPGWSVHSWTPFDNPFLGNKIRAFLDHEISLDKDFEDSPDYHREWLCRWVVESSARIYKYDPLKNGLASHDFTSPLWRYVIGLDFGYEDDTAIVVGAFHPHDDVAYIVDSWKKPRMDLVEVATVLAEWRERYRPIQIVGDCQNKQLVQSLRERHYIPIIEAEKLGKVEHIAAMNTDFRRQKLKVIEANNRALIKEWDELLWDERKRLLGHFQENPSKDNHLADAALYMHHGSKHFRAVPAPAIDPHPMRTQAEAELRAQLQKQQDAVGFYDELQRLCG